MTFKEIINAVLIRLREDTVPANWSGNINDSQTVSDYHKLIGELVNETKREVEDAWDWTALREELQTYVAYNNFINPVLGINDRSRVLSVYHPETSDALREADYLWLKKEQRSSSATGYPTHYVMQGNKISFHPLPAGGVPQPIILNLVNPQESLKLSTETLKVNSDAVILGAYARAISERGEDGGTSLDVANLNYTTTVSDLIAQDVGRVPNETEWYSA